jgi:hypothetical protein
MEYSQLSGNDSAARFVGEWAKSGAANYEPFRSVTILKVALSPRGRDFQPMLRLDDEDLTWSADTHPIMI